MSKDQKVQGDSKQIKIDSFESEKDASITVYVCNNKASVKQYCLDTYDKEENQPWLTFNEGLTRLYQGGLR
jgi:hypothetical protein